MPCKKLVLFLVVLLAACGTASPTPAPEAISVQYTAAAAPFLPDLYTCAGENTVNAALRSADFFDFQSIDLAMRIGQPDTLNSPAYQIGEEQILVIANPQNPLPALTGKQVRGLFTGQLPTWKAVGGNDAPVQVWVFPSGDDIQQLFEQVALDGSPITSQARLANSPDEMIRAIAGDVNALGILTGHWKNGEVSNVYTVTTAPVLAISQSGPDAVLSGMLACMQK